MSALADRLGRSCSTAWQEPLLCLECGERLPVIAAVVATPCPGCSRVLVSRALVRGPRWLGRAAWLSVGLSVVGALVAAGTILLDPSRLQVVDDGVSELWMRRLNVTMMTVERTLVQSPPMFCAMVAAVASVVLAIVAVRQPVRVDLLALRLQRVVFAHVLVLLCLCAQAVENSVRCWSYTGTNLSPLRLSRAAMESLVEMPHYFAGCAIAVALPLLLSFVALGRYAGVLIRNNGGLHAIAANAVLYAGVYYAACFLLAIERFRLAS